MTQGDAFIYVGNFQASSSGKTTTTVRAPSGTQVKLDEVMVENNDSHNSSNFNVVHREGIDNSDPPGGYAKLSGNNRASDIHSGGVWLTDSTGITWVRRADSSGYKYGLSLSGVEVK